MKILHISAQKPDSTGSGIYLSGLIKGIGYSHKQALIVGIDRYDDIEKTNEKFEGMVDIHPLIYNTEKLSFNLPGMSDNMPYKSTRYRDMDDNMTESMKREFSKKLKEVVDLFEPDIIICHHLYFVTAITREMYPEKKIVGICHGTCMRQLQTNRFMNEYIKRHISKLDMIFSLHQKQKEDIQKFFDIEPRKVKVLGSGYDSGMFFVVDEKKNSSEKIRISYAGKLSFSKGLIEFIKALNNLSYNKNELEVVMIGDGSIDIEKNAILEEASKCKYEIKFLGRVEQSILAEELNKSDVFVLPSYYEGLPLVILEAMACGNYIICTDIEGVSQWLGEEINNSGLIDYIDLPKMKSIGVPFETEKKQYIKRLSKGIEKAIDYRKKNRYEYIDIKSLSWKNLGIKLLDIFQSIEN